MSNNPSRRSLFVFENVILALKEAQIVIKRGELQVKGMAVIFITVVLLLNGDVLVQLMNLGFSPAAIGSPIGIGPMIQADMLGL